MPTLGQILDRNAVCYPDGAAIVFEGRRITHRAHADRVRRLAAALYDAGLRRQDRISILAMNCVEYLEVYGAAACAGYILGTVNYRLATPEIAYVVKDTAPRVLIFEAQYAEAVAALRPGLNDIELFVCIGAGPEWAIAYEDLLARGDAAGPPIRATAEDYLCLIYTSGTTGRPKGVIHTNHADAKLAEVLALELSLPVDGRFLVIMPLFHIGARSLQMAQQWRGGTVVLHRKFDPPDVLRTIERERITAIHLAPTMVQAVLDVPDFDRYDRSSLRTLLYAAAPMPLALLKRGLEAFGPVFVNGYGLTEGNGTFMHQHQHRLHGTPAEVKRLQSVGQAHPQAEIRVTNERGEPCSTGQPGEVWIRSETCMAGYWNNTVATLATIQDRWVATGDIGYLDEEGYLFLVDRKKDMIISGGENIYCREVEEAVGAHPAVHDVAVIGVPDDYWGEAVKAVVVLAPGARLEAAELIAHARRLIAPYKCPKSVEFVAELPRLPTGKINKVALREHYSAKRG